MILVSKKMIKLRLKVEELNERGENHHKEVQAFDK